ncbi:MAG TPA: hypothetical protein VFQ22_02975 [Longimicrobiales bacterium]|nr:hypothetical protein [Longimicrobiales bacterium]
MIRHLRAARMSSSLARAAHADGLDERGARLLVDAFALAMRPRLDVLDDHDPAYLHPGRSPLILLRDVGGVSAEVLAAAAVHETEDERFRTPADEVRARLGDEVADLVASLPLPGDERLLERLVLLDEPARLAAIAERLDHFRHAHVRFDDARGRALHEEAGAIWLPVAERTHPRLATRLRHWRLAYGRRLERGGAAS